MALSGWARCMRRDAANVGALAEAVVPCSTDLSSVRDRVERAAIPVVLDSDERRLFVLSEEEGLPAASKAMSTGAAVAARAEATTWLCTSGAFDEGWRTIQGVASHFVDRVRALQPRGPYRIAGVGLAGIVAYEVALQLFGADAAVELVGVVETECLEWDRRRALVRASLDDEAARPSEQTRHLRRAVLEYEVPESPLVVHLVVRCGPGTPTQAAGWQRVLRRPGQVRPIHVAEGEGAFHGTAVQALRNVITSQPPPPGGAGGPRALEWGHQSLFPIQVGRPDVPLLLCVPGAGAGVTDFVSLASLLGDDVPVHGFQSRGMEGTMLPYATVQAAARAYLHELASLRAVDGVHLVGHSFGGWIAFEMALRLQEAGRRVHSLTLLDSEWPLADGRRCREYGRVDALMKLVSLHEQAADRSLDISPGDFESRDVAAQLGLLHSRLVRVGMLPARSSWEALRGPVRSFEAAIRTRYSPDDKFLGPTTLVLVPESDESEDRVGERFASTTAGWRSVAPRLQFVRGGGNHVRLLKRPHIAAIADLLRGCLSRPGADHRPGAGQRFGQSSSAGEGQSTPSSSEPLGAHPSPRSMRRR